MKISGGYLYLALAVLLSGAAFCLGTGLHPAWWLMWIAPVPVLLVAPELSRKAAFAAGFLAWFVGTTNQWRFFHDVLRVPLPVIVMFSVLPALVFALDVLTYRGFLRNGSAWRAALVFPSIWVLFEFITARVSIHSTFGNVSYTQMNFLPVLQIASVTGIWGISFILLLFAATVSVLLSGYGGARERLLLGTAVAGVLVLVLGFGIWRLRSDVPAQSVKVGMIASDLPRNIITQNPAETMRLLQDYAGQARTLAAQGAQAIIIPEKIAVVRDSDLLQADPLLQAISDQSGAVVIVGVVHIATDAKWNEARIYSPSQPVRLYEKHHMLPPWESALKPGTTRTEWSEPSGTWGATICKDMDFPQMGRDYGNDGAGLLLVPAWDFVADGWLHGRMAILRGVESGFSIARAPKQGVLTATDDRGRVLAEQVTGLQPFATLIAVVPVWNERTIYARFGDWFAWLNVGLLVFLIGSRWASRVKEQTRGTSPTATSPTSGD
jgi:apolipoprotein N-acyltransferase